MRVSVTYHPVPTQPGTAMEFALVILKRLTNEKNALEVKERLMIKG